MVNPNRTLIFFLLGNPAMRPWTGEVLQQERHGRGPHDYPSGTVPFYSLFVKGELAGKKFFKKKTIACMIFLLR